MIKSFALTLALISAPFYALALDVVEGTHYSEIPNATASSTPKLTEFFSFYCHNCFNMETQYLPAIKANLNSQVQFDNKHVDFMNTDIGTEVMRSLAVIQHLESQTQQAQLTHAMFAAIQGEEGANGHDHNAENHDHAPQVNSREDIQKVFVKFGVAPPLYDALADSKETDAQLALWREQQNRFSIQSVPSFVVNDKYLVNLGAMKSLDDLVSTINYLAVDKDALPAKSSSTPVPQIKNYAWLLGALILLIAGIGFAAMRRKKTA